MCLCRHTEADEYAIQHCFCYTSTVLTSTLAFQKEQKLKVECQVRTHQRTRTHTQAIIFLSVRALHLLFLLQALLQVAKNLFTHLGKLATASLGGSVE